MSQLGSYWFNNEDDTISFLNKFDSQFKNGAPLTEIFTLYNFFTEFLFATGGVGNGQMSATQHSWANRSAHNQALYFYYPKEVGNPLDYETLTNQQATNSANRRFQLVATGGVGNELRLFPHKNYTVSLVVDTQTSRAAVAPTGVGTTNLLNTVPVFSTPLSDRVFQFGVHTHGTFCGFNFHLNSPSDNLTQFTEINFEICGFLNSNTTTELNHRLFILNALWERTTNPNTSILNKVGVNNSNAHGITIDDDGAVGSIVIGYIPRNAFTDSKQNFLHEIRIYNNIRRTFNIFKGTVDSRVAILGRGVFEQMKIYAFTDIFGRTGTEYWLCLGSITCSYINSNFASGEFSKSGIDLTEGKYNGSYLPNEYPFQPPIIGEYDYLLVRVKVDDIGKIPVALTGIEINPVSTNDVVEEGEWSSPLTISGTTKFIPNNTSVTVSLNSVQYTGNVTSNQWSVSVPVLHLDNLTDYSEYNVEASVIYNSLNFSDLRTFKFGSQNILKFLNIPCSLWLDASDTESLTFPNGLISNWADKSGSNNNAYMNDPAYSPSYFDGLVRVNGQGVGLITALYLDSPVSIVLLCQQFSTSSSRLLQSASNNSVISPSRSTSAFAVKSNAIRSAGLIPINTFSVTTTIFGGGNSQIWEGGTNYGSGTHSDWGELCIGGAGLFPSDWGYGDIAELLVFPSRLTTPQIQIIEGYLAHKWSNLNVLPRLGVSHPYFNSPPFPI